MPDKYKEPYNDKLTKKSALPERLLIRSYRQLGYRIPLSATEVLESIHAIF